ncbi:DUF6678 family protein [Psychromonas aquimarina]|uniref:DUF6678 family protein n=1 Tax=Psychromonas aquimarina TaxID=444919 RepID=UPI00049080F7|nr:DUF6678 family protein [Psychromonas aquimarina]
MEQSEVKADIKRQINNAINNRHLVSYMNETKWRELFSGIRSGEIEMPCRNKSLLNNNVSISVLDITTLKSWGASGIEWVEFRTMNPVNGEDLSAPTIKFLSLHSIHYSLENDAIRVWGYIEARRSEGSV